MIKRRLPWIAFVVLVAGLVLTTNTTGAQDQPAVYFPGQFITLDDPAIVAGSAWRVVFTGPDDFSVTIETGNTEAGRVYVAVPPYVDRAARTMPSVEMTVVLDGLEGSGQTIVVLEPPLPEGIDPVQLVRISKERTIAQLQETVAGYQASSDAELLQTTIDKLTGQIARLQIEVDQIRANGAISYTGDDGTSYEVSASELALSGRLLYGALAGLHQNLLPDSETTWRIKKTDQEWLAWMKEISTAVVTKLDPGTKAMVTSLETNAIFAREAPDWFPGDADRFRLNAAVTIPLMTWAKDQAADLSSIACFAVMEGTRTGLTGDDHLIDIRNRIDKVKDVVAAVGSIWTLADRKPWNVYAGVGGWLTDINNVLDNLEDWYTELTNAAPLECADLAVCSGSTRCIDIMGLEYPEIPLGGSYSGTLNADGEAWLMAAPGRSGCIQLRATGTDLWSIQFKRTYWLSTGNQCGSGSCGDYSRPAVGGQVWKVEAGAYLVRIKGDPTTAPNTAYTVAGRFSAE